MTYRFLTAVRPDGKGSAYYTAWIAEAPDGEWRLVAGFRRPKTNKHLTGFHSFLENFRADNGHLMRMSRHGNQWVRDRSGRWHEIVRARLTGDETARGRHRLDFTGGTEGAEFFLKNGGFFDADVALDTRMERRPSPEREPLIDFEALEANTLGRE